jgi:hypothetical protein
MGDRRTFTVRLSQDARGQLGEFCQEHGVTMTGLLEAFALMVGTATPERKAELVRRARDFDAANRRRLGDG